MNKHERLRERLRERLELPPDLGDIMLGPVSARRVLLRLKHGGDAHPLIDPDLPPDLEAYGDPPAWMRALLLAGVLAVVVALLLQEAGVL